MDYEKKYNEALKWMRELYPGLHGATKEDAEHYFPELRESEDERARKAALEGIEYLERKLGWDAIGDTDILDVKEYLEKQKEQKELPLMGGYADLYFDEWNQQKQNPTKRQCFEEGIRYARRLQQEQKPAEKQDYSGLTDLERAIHRGFISAGVENVPVTIIKETAKECLAQMKPAEWSEDDEKKREFLIKGLEDRMGFGWASDPFSREALISWLKSLRPQPHWKPSEEQMNRLVSIVAALRKDYYDDMADFLASLYEQLKKL